VHTVSAGYVTGAVFVMAISSWYLIKGRYIEIAKRSITVASSFGLASILSVIVLGDESGYTANENQKMKIAAIEAIWNTETAPAGLLLWAIPDQATRTNSFELKIPYLFGLIATRSFSEEVPGINQLEKQAIPRIRNGYKAYLALEKLRKDRGDSQALADFYSYEKDLGYGLLLKRVTNELASVDETTIAKAASLTVPRVMPLFIAFRVMVLCSLLLLAYFVVGFWYSTKRKITQCPWYWRVGVAFLPLPWIANSCGWFVAEYGRQPWAIEGVLPTFMAASNHDTASLIISLSMFTIFYTALLGFDIILLRKYIKTGPELFSIKIQEA
jgi:cytochrome d ubiquinol oxidase subunit I